MIPSQTVAMKLPTPFSQHLARLRKAAGLTQAQLAGRANLITSRVGAFESGRRVPSAQEVSVMATALNVGAESLTRDTDWVERAAPSLDAEASRSLQSTPPASSPASCPFRSTSTAPTGSIPGCCGSLSRKSKKDPTPWRSNASCATPGPIRA